MKTEVKFKNSKEKTEIILVIKDTHRVHSRKKPAFSIIQI